MDSWAHRVLGDPYKRTPIPPLEGHLHTRAPFLHTLCSSVHLGGSHLVVVKKTGREERRELRRN